VINLCLDLDWRFGDDFRSNQATHCNMLLTLMIASKLFRVHVERLAFFVFLS
jgi:hypothetical protein